MDNKNKRKLQQTLSALWTVKPAKSQKKSSEWSDEPTAPSCNDIPYSLHPRPHDRIVPQVENLMRKTFLTRILYNS